jgi:hypothetical protein
VLICLSADSLSAAPAITATQDDNTPAATRKAVGDTITYSTTITNTAPVIVGSTANDATGLQLTNPTPANTTDTGTVSISPVAIDDVYPQTVIGNVAINSANIPYSVLGNDFQGQNGGAVTITAFDATTANGGQIVMTTSGADIGKFTYNPPPGFVGTDSFTYTMANSVGSSTGTVRIPVAGMIWFINNNAAACTTLAAGCGRLSNPFSSVAAFQALNNGTGSNPAANHAIFIFESSTAYTGPVTLLNGQTLVGQDAHASLAAILGITVPTGSAALPVTSPGAPEATLTTTVANTNAIQIANAASATIRGLSIGNTTGSGIAMNSGATTFGTLTVSDLTDTGTGQALNLTSGTLNATYGLLSSSSSVNVISLTTVGGTLTINNNTSAISGATGADILINGGAMSFTYAGTITNTAGRSIDIQNKTGGTVAFSGAISDTGTGIHLNANTGATVSFTGGLNLNTGVNAAFTATSGGTVTATQNNSTIVNTLTTTSGAALNVANTTIGAAGLTFRSISSNGAPKAIILNTTGTVGGLSVTGTGTAGTGGTIQNNSTRGAEFINTANLSLKRMNFTNANNSVDGGGAGVCDDYTLTGCNAAIYMSGVSGFAIMDGLNITGTMVENGITAINVVNFKLDNSLLDGCGNEANESCVEAQNLSGTATVNNTIIQFSETDALAIVNNEVSLNLTINGSTFQDSQTQSSGGPANTNGEGGFQFRSFSRAMLVNGVASTGGFVPVTTINVINSNFLRLATQGIQVFSSDDSVLNLDVTGCNVDSGTGTGTGLDLNADVSSIYSFNVINNPHIKSRGGAAVNITSFRSGHIEGRINNNPDIQVQSGPGIPVRMVAQETSNLIVQVDNNTVSNINGTEDTQIDVQSRFQSARADVTITRNTVTGEPTGVAGINIISGSSTAGESNITCADVGGNGLGNNVTNAAGNTLRGFRVRNSDLSNTNRLYLAGFTSDTATTWINRGNLPASSTEVAVSVTGTGVLPSAPPGGVCRQVDTPSDFLLAGEGGVEARRMSAATKSTERTGSAAFVQESGSPVVAAMPSNPALAATADRPDLSQEQLDRAVAEAISTWTASGLTDDQIATLRALVFEVADLSGQHLGEAHAGRIRVDRDAGGDGWFVEDDAREEAPFRNEVSATRRYTDPTAAPAGRMDLFTAILHEMGHALGLDDTYSGSDRDKLMYGFLTKGERRLPGRGQAAGAVPAADGTRAHFLSAPVNIGTLPPGKSVKIVYSVTVGPISGNPQQVSSQGTVSGSNFSSVPTSDAVAGSGATNTLLAIAPAFTSADATTFTVGTAGSFNVTANGAPAPSYSHTGTLPSGVTFSAAGVLSGTPAAGTGGSYPVTITANNGIAPNATQSFTLTVNQPAAITSANATTFTVGTAGTFTVTTTGFPKPALAQGSTLPSGVTFVDNGDGTATLSGTPAAGTGGTYPFTITGANGVGSNATQNFTLTVNEAPAITSANTTTFTVGMTGSFTVTKSGFPAPTLSMTGTLPSGVTFTPGSGELSGTPAAGTGGSYPVTFTASNGVGSNATQNFTLVVNQPAAITSANNTTFVVGTAGTFTVTKSGFPSPTLSMSGTLPSGVTFDTASGVLSGTPAAGTGGSYPLTFTASNGVASDATQNFTLTINQTGAITSASSTTFTVGTNGSFTVTTSGTPAPAITVGGDALPFNLTFVDNGDGTGTLSGMPAAGTGGVYNLTFTAGNGGGSQNFTLTVNEAPTITSANSITFTVGNTGSHAVTVTGYPAPTVTESGALPPGVTFNAGILSGTPAQGSAGSYPITFTASNGVGSDHVQNFALTVNDSVCMVAPADLVAWYPAEGNAIDVESGNTGAALNGAGYANAKAGQGFTFNGSTSVIEVPNAPAWNFGANNFTVQTWVNFAAISGSDVLVGHSEGSGSVNKWLFWLKSGKLEFQLNGSAVSNITSDATFTPVLGRWYHVAVTRTGNTYKFYVDGVQNGTDRFDSNTVPTANAPLTLGKAEALAAMSGSLDEVQIFSRALTGAEIQSVYNASTEGLCVEAPATTSAASRKTHGLAGAFDLNLPLTGAPGVECRSAGATGDHTMVVSFNNTVTEGNAAVSSGSVSGTPTFSGNTMTINLTGVPNAQQITVSLTNVKDAFAQVLPSTSISMNVLLGDTTGNKAVTASDIAQVKAESGQPITPANFRIDVSLNGILNGSDLSMTKSASGTIIP